MSVYSYKAADISGKIVKGTLDAADEKSAADRLHDMGYIPIKISQTGNAAGQTSLRLSGDIFSFFKKASVRDVMLFTQDLSALLTAGLPVDRALSILISVTEKEKFKEIVRDILKSVEGGSYLSDAMAKHPRAFSDFYVNMIRAGEAGGVLDAVLERLGEFLESSQELRDYVKSALIYPIFLVFVGGISIIILMTFVIPKFSVMFSDMGDAIPLSAWFLMGLSEFLRAYWWIIVVVMTAAYLSIHQYIRTPAGRLQSDILKIRLPIIGDMVRKIEVARFARTLGTRWHDLQGHWEP